MQISQSSIIGKGAYIHILVFCTINVFGNRLLLFMLCAHEYMNISPAVTIEIATALNRVCETQDRIDM